MSPAPRISLRLSRDASGAVRFAAAPDRSPLIATAGTALSQLATAATAPDARPVDVQPVVEISDAAGYERWRADREAIWRAQGGQFTTAGWPEQLPPDQLAAVLLPLAYGTTAARGARKAPRVVADQPGPLFSIRALAESAGPDDIAVGLIAEWLRQAATGPALRVAPPFVEQGGERRELDLGLRWTLAARAG